MDGIHQQQGSTYEIEREAINQVNPISGTEYEVMATSKHVEILLMSAHVVWTLQPTPLEIHIYINGVKAITHTRGNPATATEYYANSQPESPLLSQTFTGTLPIIAKLWPRIETIRVTAEITGGTVQNLYCRFLYGHWRT